MAARDSALARLLPAGLPALPALQAGLTGGCVGPSLLSTGTG